MRWSRLSVAAFLVMGLLVLGTLNIAGRLPINGPTEPQLMKQRYEAIAGKDAVSLGGSIGTAIDFDAMCVSGARFYNNGQDVFETEALVDLILSRPDAPQIIILVTSPASIGHDNGLPALAGAYQRRFTYRFLHGEGEFGLIDGDLRQAVFAEAMPAIGHHLRNPWHGAALRWLGRLPAPDVTTAADTRSIDPRQAEALAKAQVAAWQADATEIAYFDPHVHARTRAALLRIAEKVEDRGAQLVVVLPPFIDQMSDPLREAGWTKIDTFWPLLQDLERRNALVLNDWDNRAARLDPSHFRDAVHLNAPGAKEYSKKVGRELRRQKLVQRRDCK